MVRDILTELVCKECESYQLIEMGLLSSVEEGVALLTAVYPSIDASVLDDFSCFREWRKEVLHFFYKQLNYAGFIQRVIDTPTFRRFLLMLKRRIVASLYEQCKEATIDKELVVSAKTLAFKLSVLLEEELFRLERTSLLATETPIRLEGFCRDNCRQFFPIDLERLMMQLKKDDSEFWNELYLTVKKLAQTVTYGQLVSIQYKDEVLQEVWSESSLLLHDKVLQEAVPAFETSLHFRNYIARICLNKCREAVRRYNLPDSMLTMTGDVSLDLSGFNEEMETVDFHNTLFEGIDFNNKAELERYFSVILWDKQEPWYSDLTRGIEDKVELIFLHYVEGLSYEKIAVLKDAKASGEGLSRLAGKLRQEVVRTRRVLKQRFDGMIEKKLGK